MKKKTLKIILMIIIGLLVSSTFSYATNEVIIDEIENIDTNEEIVDKNEQDVENKDDVIEDNIPKDNNEDKEDKDDNEVTEPDNPPVIENEIEVKYEYDLKTNKVIAKIVSTKELKNTKPSWKLSEDKLTYTKIFDSNTEYTTPVQDIDGKETVITIKITQVKTPEITIESKYDEKENKVIVYIISNTKLKDTKPSWKLSEDGHTYTKIFDSNMNYITPVEDIYGNVINTNINVKIKTGITIKNFYNKQINQVTVQIISKTKIKDTKPSWKLSEDGYTYTKVFDSNTKYTTPVEDINGKTEIVEINVTEILPFEITTNYTHDKQTNLVTVTINSNTKLKDTKPTWKLSEDGYTYTKIFSSNMTYTTPVEDINGNIVIVEIKINQIDKQAPKITIEYKYNTDDTVTIYLKSNKQLGNTKPNWELSSDGLIYEKTFVDNQDYYTSVQDIYGNTTKVRIKLKKKTVEQDSQIKMVYIYTSYNNVIAQIISTEKIQDTKPSWKLSEDGYIYTKIFDGNTEYTTPIKNINGEEKNVHIKIDLFYEIKYEKGIYGQSGAKIHGVQGGSDLEYLKFGDGENVFFATFCVHGYEDSWERDGSILVDIAKNFYNRLINDKDYNLAKKWTIYVFPEVNPDGRRLGNTENGPGRTTVYSKIGKGIDINRCWQTGSDYTIFTDNRNYNGTQGFQAYEAEYLRDFLLRHKSQNGQTVLVDLHGWEEQLIGNEQVCKYYKQQYTSCATRKYGQYGNQYLVTWANKVLGAKSALVELPYASSYSEANNMRLCDKYINATLNMLRGI